MSDKMREAFEKWYMTNTFAHIDHISVFYNDLNCYPAPIANHCWKAWQAAQSSAVPVGMRVSVDVSTGEHDAFNRVFAVVTGQQYDGQGGMMLLCEEESRNFEQSVSTPVVGEVVAWECRNYYNDSDDAGWGMWFSVSEDIYNSKSSIDEGSREYRALIVQPATSITTAELDKIRAYIADGIESEGITEHNHSIEARKLVKIIDAAIAGEGEK